MANPGKYPLVRSDFIMLKSLSFSTQLLGVLLCLIPSQIFRACLIFQGPFPNCGGESLVGRVITFVSPAFPPASLGISVCAGHRCALLCACIGGAAETGSSLISTGILHGGEFVSQRDGVCSARTPFPPVSLWSQITLEGNATPLHSGQFWEHLSARHRRKEVLLLSVFPPSDAHLAHNCC